MVSGPADGVHVCHDGPVAEETQDGKDARHQTYQHREDHDEETPRNSSVRNCCRTDKAGRQINICVFNRHYLFNNNFYS